MRPPFRFAPTEQEPTSGSDFHPREPGRSSTVLPLGDQGSHALGADLPPSRTSGSGHDGSFLERAAPREATSTAIRYQSTPDATTAPRLLHQWTSECGADRCARMPLGESSCAPSPGVALELALRFQPE